MTKNYKPPATRFGKDSWSLLCPIQSYRVTRGLFAEKPDVLKREDTLRIHSRIIYPDELSSHRVEINITKTNKPFTTSDNPPHIAIGAFALIEEDYYSVQLPAQTDYFEDIVRSLVDTDSSDGISRELWVEVIGLLNEWDRSGHLDVTKIEFCLGSWKRPEMTPPPNFRSLDVLGFSQFKDDLNEKKGFTEKPPDGGNGGMDQT